MYTEFELQEAKQDGFIAGVLITCVVIIFTLLFSAFIFLLFYPSNDFKYFCKKVGGEYIETSGKCLSPNLEKND